VIAAIFGILAARSSPSHHEREALAIRQRALHEARSSLALGALIPIAGALLRPRRNAPRRYHCGGGSNRLLRSGPSNGAKGAPARTTGRGRPCGNCISFCCSPWGAVTLTV
jgi:hypothetical protein